MNENLQNIAASVDRSHSNDRSNDRSHSNLEIQGLENGEAFPYPDIPLLSTSRDQFSSSQSPDTEIRNRRVSLSRMATVGSNDNESRIRTQVPVSAAGSYDPDSGDGAGTLFSSKQIEWDGESLAVVQKYYYKMVFASIFIAIVTPLCCRYVLSTMRDTNTSEGNFLGLHLNPHGHWNFDQFTWIELSLLFVLVMGQFANIVKWFGILSGYPNSPMNGIEVELEGHAVLGTCTPILGENDAVFLRSLLGRHCATFHTIGGRHDIEGLCVDIFSNELRTRSGENIRQNQWCAWMEFLQFLADIPIQEMSWYYNPKAKESQSRSHSIDILRKNQQQPSIAPDSPVRNEKGNLLSPKKNLNLSERQVKKLERMGKAHSLLSFKSFSNDDLSNVLRSPKVNTFTEEDMRSAQVPYATTRCVRVSKNERVMYDTSSVYNFEGVHLIETGNGGKKFKDDGVLAPTHLGSPISGVYGSNSVVSSPLSPVHTECRAKVKDIWDIMPMMAFLDNWLELVKSNDNSRDNNKNIGALQDIFNKAPVSRFFQGTVLLEVQNKLRDLYEVFAREKSMPVEAGKFANLTGVQMHEISCHRDEILECHWKVNRSGLKDWDVCFSFISRGKLVAASQEHDPNDGQIIMDNTQIIKDSIVFYEKESLCDWLESRKYGTYKVVKDYGQLVSLVQWPTKKGDAENPEDGESSSGEIIRGVNKKDLHLYCGQRGKAGALHFAMDYLRKRGHEWCSVLANPPVNRIKTIFSVIDARHMITEPHVYFNNALPHFARGFQGEDIKGYAPKQDVYLVQYPQYYDDVPCNVWNARNSIHWTVSQFVQDYGRCCVSTGSNSLWDISPKGFDFLPLAGSCRVDDTAATLSHIKTKIIVHMPVFCSMGVSRPKINDMLDTWTRWAAGNVELSWILLTSRYIQEYGVCHALYMVYMASNFVPSSIALGAWMFLLLGVYLWSFVEKANGRLPFRDLCAYFKYWECATFSVDRITSIIPVYAILLNIAMYNSIPMLSTPSRALFWVLWVVLIRLPTLYMMDRSISMLRVFNKKTTKENFCFSSAIWDANCFEQAAMPLGFLALAEGTYQGLSAALFNRDITFWAATGVKANDVDKKYVAMRYHENKCSFDFIKRIFAYIDIRIRAFYKASRSPLMCVTAYLSFVQISVFALVGYIWVKTDDRTNLICAFLAFYFNMHIFAGPSKRLITPIKWFWSHDFNFEYYFLPLSVLLICYITPQVELFKIIGEVFK